MQCDAMRCPVGLRGAAVSTTPLAVIAVVDEPDGLKEWYRETSKVSRTGAGLLLVNLATGCGAEDEPVADALIRATAVDVLQEGKKKQSDRRKPDKDQINSRQAGARQDWILR